jgi:hypothetical protein
MIRTGAGNAHPIKSPPQAGTQFDQPQESMRFTGDA